MINNKIQFFFSEALFDADEKRRDDDKILATIYNPRVEVSLSEDKVLKSKSIYCSMLRQYLAMCSRVCLLAIGSDLRLNILV